MKLAPLLIITFIGLVSLMLQWSKHRGLISQIPETRSEEKLSSYSKPQSRMERSKSSSKTAELRQQLENYLAALEEDKGANSLSNLLAILANATPADLSTLIKEMQDDRNSDAAQPGRYSSLLPTLKLFYAELAPLDALESGNGLSAFEALSRKFPAEAVAWLEGASLSEKEHKDYLNRYHMIQILQNPAENLDHWPEDCLFNTTRVPVIGPSGINNLLPEITRPENADIRESLVTSVLYSSLLEGEGLARSRIESLGLETDTIISSLESSEDLACRETLEWAIDLGKDTPGGTLNLSESIMATFAQKDLNTAAVWLNGFEGNPSVKDQLTARYAMVLSATDPEASQVWIAKIQDEEQRNRVMRNTLYQWEKDDPQAFAAWQKK